MKHPTIRQTVLAMMAFHDGQIDKGGNPYYRHPLRVMIRLGASKPEHSPMMHAALLHDVMEDCGVTRAQLLDLGYTSDEIDMIELVSRPQGMSYRDFIRRLMNSGDKRAMRIKLADLYDNSNPARLQAMRDGGIDPTVILGIEQMIAARYEPAIFQIRSVLGNEAYEVLKEDFEVEMQDAA